MNTDRAVPKIPGPAERAVYTTRESPPGSRAKLLDVIAKAAYDNNRAYEGLQPMRALGAPDPYATPRRRGTTCEHGHGGRRGAHGRDVRRPAGRPHVRGSDPGPRGPRGTSTRMWPRCRSRPRSSTDSNGSSARHVVATSRRSGWAAASTSSRKRIGRRGIGGAGSRSVRSCAPRRRASPPTSSFPRSPARRVDASTRLLILCICTLMREERAVPRRRKQRICREFDGDTVFKPRSIPMRELETVALRLDEFEAMRLCDLDGHDQEAAGRRMGVSRGTVQRLLQVRARQASAGSGGLFRIGHRKRSGS